MTSESRKVAIIHQLNLIADSIDTRWHTLMNRQVDELEKQIEATWEVVCRRKR